MSKATAYIFVFFLLAAPQVLAQDGQSPLPVVSEDTVIIHSPPEEDGAVFGEASAAELRLAERKADSAVISALRNDPDLSYERTTVKKETIKNDWLTNLASQGWFKTLLWVIIILAFLAIVIAFLYRSNVSIFRRKVRSNEENTEEAGPSENIFDINYESAIRKAVNAGQYPLAVRLYYLQTLKNLSASGLIDYRQEKTNGDYMFELFNSPHYKTFFSLTRHYEYVWYGKFPVSKDVFQSMQTEFSEFNRRLAA